MNATMNETAQSIIHAGHIDAPYTQPAQSASSLHPARPGVASRAACNHRAPCVQPPYPTRTQLLGLELRKENTCKTKRYARSNESKLQWTISSNPIISDQLKPTQYNSNLMKSIIP